MFKCRGREQFEAVDFWGAPVFDSTIVDEVVGRDASAGVEAHELGGAPSRGFHIGKRTFDIVLSLHLLALLATFGIALRIANPIWNRGPLFYVQTRMGRDCQPFRAVKFRTMTEAPAVIRDANSPIEVDRITRLGGFLRKTRIDELPQIINVLKGEMSLIGPRPDYFEHAEHFVDHVPGYRERHVIRPGISGLAQTEVGYAVGTEGTRHKVNADLYYIANASLRLEAWIIWRTFAVIFQRAGE